MKPQITIVAGGQWGDEGKGKMVDIEAGNADIVVRAQGGSNAGHTIYHQGKKIVLHLVPSGIFQLGASNYIGPNVVLNPMTFIDEVKALEASGIKCENRLFASARTSLIMPYHIQLDALREELRGAGKIGTTGRGIGPAYEDLVGRRALLLGDLANLDEFTRKLKSVLVEKNLIFHACGKHEFSVAEIMEQFTPEVVDYLRRFTKPEFINFLNDEVDSGKRILIEGAQGVLLDVLHGTTPFVTSSQITASALASSLGLAPHKISRVVGIIKAYTTRVGEGPFPTELFDEQGEKIREKGQEFGATTGRPRRCGWLDMPAVRYAIRISGATEIIMTKADVLCGFETVRVNNSYSFEGHRLLGYLPIERISDVRARNEIIFPGWASCREDKNFTNFLTFLQDNLPVPITKVSIGQNREDIITL